MSNWLSAINPSASIDTEAEAEAAARSSAISIIIGVIVGAVTTVWSAMHPEIVIDAVTKAGGDATMAAAQAQISLYTAGALVLIQLIFAVFQWRNPKNWIAILFIVLLVLGVLMTAVAPVLTGMVPGAPATPMWQIALTLVIYAVQLILHVAGLRGINRLDEIQMDAAR